MYYKMYFSCFLLVIGQKKQYSAVIYEKAAHVDLLF